MLGKYSLSYIIGFIILAIIPVFIREYYILHLLILSLVWAIVAQNWNLMLGYAGMFHFAQIAFFAIGSYASSILAIYFGVSPWLGLLIGGGLAVLASILIGLPSLRVKGIYLILLTFAFHFLLLTSIFHFRDITGGTQGLVDVPPFELGPITFGRLDKIPSFYLALIIFVISFLFLKKVIGSKVGTAFVALRDSEVYAISRGINPYKYKLMMFALSSFFAGVMGAFYAHYLQFVSYEVLGFGVVLNTMGMVVIGGMGTLAGPVFGSFLLTFVSEYLRGAAEFRNLIIGLLMVLILIFYPTGLIALFDRAKNALSRMISS